jgi:hypothetical protein
VSVPITTYKNASGIKTSYFAYGVAAQESLGTVCVDETFLSEYTYVVRLKAFDPLGVVITDYLADVILATNSNYKGKSYSSLLGEYIPDETGIGTITINGILHTGYKDRYQALIDRVTVNKETDLAVLYNDEEFQKFSSELYSFLAYCYSFNPNYVQDYLASGENHTYAWSHKLRFGDKTDYTISSGYVGCDTALRDGQVIMSYKM